MSVAAHYKFIAEIKLKNASENSVKRIRDICNKVFQEKRSSRRSNVYWTASRVEHYRPSDSFLFNPNSILIFEIDDAESVRELNRIEDKIRVECADISLRRIITSIDCRHVRTR